MCVCALEMFLDLRVSSISCVPLCVCERCLDRGRADSLWVSKGYGVGRVSVTGLVEGLYILHHGELTAVGGRFFYARHLENVVFDLGGLPLRP